MDDMDARATHDVAMTIRAARIALEKSPRDADGIPCLMDEMVWDGAEWRQVVAASHRGRVALRGHGRGVTWTPARSVTHRRPESAAAVRYDLTEELAGLGMGRREAAAHAAEFVRRAVETGGGR